MPLSSWEEDELFASYGWTKDLIRRQYESPKGLFLTFDAVMEATQSPEGEQALRQIVQQYGTQQNKGDAND